VIALLLFGTKRLPEAGRSLGNAIREFKKALNGEHDKKDDSNVGHDGDKK
jgi:sec-independent protein translocase protein TatA